MASEIRKHYLVVCKQPYSLRCLCDCKAVLRGYACKTSRVIWKPLHHTTKIEGVAQSDYSGFCLSQLYMYVPLSGYDTQGIICFVSHWKLLCKSRIRDAFNDCIYVAKMCVAFMLHSGVIIQALRSGFVEIA